MDGKTAFAGFERAVIESAFQAASELAALTDAATAANKTHVVVPVASVRELIAGYTYLMSASALAAPGAHASTERMNHQGKGRKRRTSDSGAN